MTSSMTTSTFKNMFALINKPTGIGKTHLKDLLLQQNLLQQNLLQQNILQQDVRVTRQQLKPKKGRNTFKYEKPCKSLKHNNFKRVVYTW